MLFFFWQIAHPYYKCFWIVLRTPFQSKVFLGRFFVINANPLISIWFTWHACKYPHCSRACAAEVSSAFSACKPILPQLALSPHFTPLLGWYYISKILVHETTGDYIRQLDKCWVKFHFKYFTYHKNKNCKFLAMQKQKGENEKITQVIQESVWGRWSCCPLVV